MADPALVEALGALNDATSTRLLLPIVVDPSHSAGKRELVVPLTRAAIAVGADAVMVDVHADPTAALCDGPQALYGEALDELAQACRDLPPVLGRKVG